MTDYQQQANQFLADTGTTFSIKYQYTGPYFDDDKEKRDVYQFTLRNARGEYFARFGDSAHNTARRVWATDNTGRAPLPKDLRKLTSSELFRERSKLRNITPTAYDVLACLQKSDVGTFAEFCADFGYDARPLSEYPNAMRIYDAVSKEYAALRRMYTPAELDQLGEIA